MRIRGSLGRIPSNRETSNLGSKLYPQISDIALKQPCCNSLILQIVNRPIDIVIIDQF